MPRPLARTVLAALLTIGCATAALAGASSTPFGYTPDPSLRTASRADIEGRFRRSCQVIQARIRNVSESSLARPCGCYASRTLRSLDAGEMEAYRTTGVFDDTARQKALAAVDACKLTRPF